VSETDLTFVDEAVERIGRSADATIPLLQALQRHYGYLPREAMERVCRLTEITPARLEGVAGFYDQFRFRPMGEHVIRVCHGTACHVKGAPLVTDALRSYLRIGEDDDTDPHGRFTVQKVACLGCCTLAPAVQIDDVTYGHLTPQRVERMVKDFLRLQKQRGRKKPPTLGEDELEGRILIGMDSCCVARGCGEVYAAVEDTLRRTGARAAIKPVGCVGSCSQTPLVEVVPREGRPVLYEQVTAGEARDIVLRHFAPGGALRRVSTVLSHGLDKLLNDEAWEPPERHAVDVRDPQMEAFFGPQKHVAIEGIGRLDPLDLDEYVAGGGFSALRRCVHELSADEVIDQVLRSGLRGRGGAGYLTGRKWSQVRKATGGTKMIVCNCDEGDPGAFMDRMLLESFPYRVLEGIAIGARAVGASEGVLYIRAEYPLAVERVREVLARCRESGYLGGGICGGDVRLELRILEGAGAFVCGEETALLASIEGRRGTPRLRPPYPAQQGLFGRPTLVNNVETFCCVPWILRNGPDAFAAMGTPGNKGTKVFALAGKVVRGGLIEVPMGMTIRRIIEDVGGGIAGGHTLKAVQIGGPSGGCVPAELADTPVDYDALVSLGAMMGSGGLVALDETDCMVDVARYFLEFTQDQSCGKCAPCRVGTRQMLEILRRLCDRGARPDDLQRLEELAHYVQSASLCGLGRTAPNPVLTTLRYFREEYEAHLAGRCPAGKCKALATYSITDDCIGCTLCAQHCPADAIELRPYEKHAIDSDLCVRCGTCLAVCPSGAVKVE
jgi:NADH-quinone oxidoreductase subunit F